MPSITVSIPSEVFFRVEQDCREKNFDVSKRSQVIREILVSYYKEIDDKKKGKTAPKQV